MRWGWFILLVSLGWVWAGCAESQELPAPRAVLDGLCVLWDAHDPDCVPGSCGANGVCESGCRTRDPDCPALVAPPMGVVCRDAADCEQGVCVEIGNDDEYRQRFCTSFCTLSEDGVEHSCETTNECLSTAGKFGVCASQDSCGGFYGGAQAVPLACCQVGGKGGAQAALLVLVVAALAGLRRRRRDRR